MAVVQYTWLFDPSAVRREIAEKTYDPEQGRLNVHALVREARFAASHATPAARLYLRAIRFEEQYWLKEDATVFELWMVCLAPYVTNERSSLNSSILDEYLRFLGWAEPAVRRAMQGESFESLFGEEEADDPLARAMRDDLWRPDFGGWMSRSTAADVYTQLVDIEASVRSPDPDYLERYQMPLGQADRVRSGLSESFEMLVEALRDAQRSRGLALRVITTD